jgi:hypothetical protein
LGETWSTPHGAEQIRLEGVQTDDRECGLAICAYGYTRDSTPLHAMAMRGTEIIFMPSAGVVQPDHDKVADPDSRCWLNAFRPIVRESSGSPERLGGRFRLYLNGSRETAAYN